MTSPIGLLGKGDTRIKLDNGRRYHSNVIAWHSYDSPYLNPCLSRNSFPCCRVLIKICDVLVPGPAVAKTTVPLLLLTRTGSSLIFAFLHFAWITGSPLIPNCDTKPGSTRKKRHPSQNDSLVSSSKRLTPLGAHSVYMNQRYTWEYNVSKIRLP